jgi:hypothetical protein
MWRFRYWSSAFYWLGVCYRVNFKVIRNVRRLGSGRSNVRLVLCRRRLLQLRRRHLRSWRSLYRSSFLLNRLLIGQG